MFTGIIMAVGRIAAVESTPGGARVRIDAGGLELDDVAIGVTASPSAASA